jgi:hypothetical protein
MPTPSSTPASIHLVEVPASSTGSIEAQTREVLEAIGRQLAKLGSDPVAHPDGHHLPRRHGRLRRP